MVPPLFAVYTARSIVSEQVLALHAFARILVSSIGETLRQSLPVCYHVLVHTIGLDAQKSILQASRTDFHQPSALLSILACILLFIIARVIIMIMYRFL
ncbi:hypothetical protein E1B06_21830 [Brevibacillus laterosporus]|nr:hypothetical protein [Brevibacillus laterosporus]